MSVMEELKQLAVKQMRAAADLYAICENAEKELVGDELHDKLCLRSIRDYRYDLLEKKYELTASQEEKDLWDNVLEQLD